MIHHCAVRMMQKGFHKQGCVFPMVIWPAFRLESTTILTTHPSLYERWWVLETKWEKSVEVASDGDETVLGSSNFPGKKL